MRWLIILLLVSTVGCATTLPAAGPSSNPMDRADTIYILTDDKPIEVYKKIAQIFSDKGFAIANSDETLLNIATEPYDLKQTFGDLLAASSGKIQLNASVRETDSETQIVLKGRYGYEDTYYSAYSSSTQTGGDEIAMRGAKNSYTMRGWEYMVEVAESYPNARLEYSRNR